MTDGSERIIVARCREADREAQMSLVRQCSACVFAICYAMLGNRHDAEDAAQEALLKILQGIGGLKDDVRFKPWIRRITKNLCIDILRGRERRKKVLELRDEPTESESPDRAALARALQGLPAESREALMLYYFEQQSAKGMAQMLGISEDAAYTRLSRARKRLRQCLEAEGD